MAKFNEKSSAKTLNRAGFPAYKMEEKEELVAAVLTTMFGEPKFYGSTDERLVLLATSCAEKDPQFLCSLTCYARNAANLRSVSHVLACVTARHAHEYTRTVIRNIVVRPDDITEIMACYLKMYGKPFPNALKRGIAEAMLRFDEHGFAKYSGRHQSMKFRDILCITHPVPGSREKEVLFRKILEGTLKTPDTWEVRLSAGGDKKEAWDELIASGNVGYMALLRNMRNIIRCGADIGPVLAVISDPDRVEKSRQLPFRFFSAYLWLKRARLMTPEIQGALEQALTVSVGNMETIPGRSLIAIDISASMNQKISSRSKVRCADIAVLLGVLANRPCEEADVCYFDYEGCYSRCPEEKGYMVKKYGKDEPVLEICSQARFTGGGTQMELPMRYALEEDPKRKERPYDRVIYFSDNICNNARYGLLKTVQGLVDAYREQYNRDFWVHGVDLQGYGTQQFCGRNFNLIAGWSDTVLPFINLAERGISSLAVAIGEYSVN